MQRIRFLFCALALFIFVEAQAQPNGQIQNSLVRITSTEVEPDYRALFVNDDPNDRVLALANDNCDIAEYWEWSADERFPVDVTSGAYELGVNYIIYGMTH